MARPADRWQHMLVGVPGAFVADDAVSLGRDDDIWMVVPGLEYSHDGVLTTCDRWQQWSVFVKHMDEAFGEDAEVAPRSASASSSSRCNVPDWAQQWLQRGSQGGGGSSAGSSAGTTAVPIVLERLTEEQQAAVQEEVAEMRAWLAALIPSVGREFAVRVLGGEFTQKKHRKAWDALQAYARTKRSQQWCADFRITLRCGLPGQTLIATQRCVWRRAGARGSRSCGPCGWIRANIRPFGTSSTRAWWTAATFASCWRRLLQGVLCGSALTMCWQ